MLNRILKTGLPRWTALAMTALLFPLFFRSVTAQAAALQYQIQPNQVLRYRLELCEGFNLAAGGGQALPVTTRTTIQASVRMVEGDSDGAAALQATIEEFSASTTLGSKEVSSPASAASGQTKKFSLGPAGLLSGQDGLSASSGVPWGVFLSQVFPDLNRCRYLGEAVFDGRPCARIGLDAVAAGSVRVEGGGAAQTRNYNQGKGTALLAGGHLVSGETQGVVDVGYNIFTPDSKTRPVAVSAKGSFSSRLSLIP